MFETPLLMLSRIGETFQIYVATQYAERLFADLRAAGFHGRIELGAYRAGELEEEVSIIYLDECEKLPLREWLKEWKMHF